MSNDTFTPSTVIASGAYKGDFAWSVASNWSAGLPGQNSVATLGSRAIGYVLLVDGTYSVNQIVFGNNPGALTLLIESGDSLNAANGANVAAGSTLTIAPASAGAFTTNGFEVNANAALAVLGGSFTSSNGFTVDTGASATFGAGVGFNVNVLDLNGTARLSLDVGSTGAPHVISNVNQTGTASTLTIAGGDVQIGSGGGGTYVVSNSGTLEFTGSLGSAASIDLQGGLVQLDGNVTLQAGDSFAFSGSSASTLDVVSGNNFQNGFGYAVTGFDYGDRLQFGNLNLTGDTASYNSASHTLTISSLGQTVLSLSKLSLASDVKAPASFILGGNTVQLACFLSGTLIETEAGPVAVEMLDVGDAVVTFEGAARVLRRVRWTGRRTVDAACFEDQQDAYPVRIRANAFGQGLPRRDLLVTGDHGIYVQGGLIPARMLVNGRSIVRDTSLARHVVHHVELERHSILLAEGLPAESYLDTGNRGSFETPGHGRIEGSALPLCSSDEAAPLTVSRALVEPVWRALDARCDRIGLARPAATALTTDCELRLLLADGSILHPRWRGEMRSMFQLPRGAQPARLLSRAARPSEVIGPFMDDRRRLGIAVRYAVLWNGLSDVIVPAAELGGAGWYPLEDGQRWTDGDAALALPAASGLAASGPAASDAACFLEIELAALMQYAARAPVAALRAA